MAVERNPHQPALMDSPSIAAEPLLPAGSAQHLPVAQVLLESSVPHLDRSFDYAVPRDLTEKVVPGCRVKVRFSGRELAGYVLGRSEASTTAARLSSLHKVVSALPVLSPEIHELAEQVAARYAGITSDVVRAAVPPRVAGVEKEFAEFTPPQALASAEPRPASVQEPATPGPRRAVLALGKESKERSAIVAITEAVRRCLEQQRQVVIVVPDQRDVQRLGKVLEQEFGTEQVARLSAEMGPTPRYRSFLRLRYGQAQIALGTRSAVFAPVPELGLMVVLDDDDSSHAEPRAPYHHAREVALLRTVQTGAELVFVSTARSLEVQRLVEKEWLVDDAPPAVVRRAQTPHVLATADSYHQERDPSAHGARMPHAAYRVAQQALEYGPVLIQVGRAGFVPSLVCERCRGPQHCPQCHGPLALPAHHAQSRSLRCRWCGLHHRQHRCAHCGHGTFRAAARGADRTAQELGRAFPHIPVISSTGDQPVDSVGAQPALVVSTPGVEPPAASGYSAALLLDGDAQLLRDGLDIPRQVLSRWIHAASLVRPRHRDPARSGTVVVTASHQELTGALVSWDPVGYARTELRRRAELALPPASRMVSLTGDPAEALPLMNSLALPEGLDWIGPTPAEQQRQRWLLFFSYAQAPEVVAELRRVRRRSSAGAGTGRGLRIAVDDIASLQF